MLHFSAINWNASDKNIEPTFKVNFPIRDRENIGFKFYIILINQTESALPSCENEKEKIFQGFG